MQNAKRKENSFFCTTGRRSISIVITQEKPSPRVHTRRAAATFQVLLHHLSPSIRHQVHADDGEKHFIIYIPSADLI
jgi:hypothetical protein